MTAAETIRALRDAIAAERRAADEESYARAQYETGGISRSALDRSDAGLNDAQSATDAAVDALADAVDAAPALTPELRAALDAMVEADAARAKAREDYSDAWKGDTSRLGEIGQRVDRATEARSDAVGAIIALWGAP